MRKIVLAVLVLFIFSALWLAAADKLPEGRRVKVYIQNKTLQGELISVTPDLIIIRLFEKGKAKDKRIIMGCPVADTEIVKLVKNCGPIGNIFAKGRKYNFKKSTQTKIQENIADLSHNALYGSMIPNFIKEQMKLFGQA
jgi:hypothetical protein